MINVFKNRARLCALTTGAFLFLQGVDTSVGNDSASSVSGKAAASSVKVDTEQAVVKEGEVVSCESGGYKLDRSPIRCDDAQRTIRVVGGSISVKKRGDNAVYATGTWAPQDITIRNVSIRGVDFSADNEAVDVSNEAEEIGWGSGVYMTINSKANLNFSNIHNFPVGLEAQMEGNIVMKNGIIRRSVMGAVAGLNSSIYLNKVAIFAIGNGLVSTENSRIFMKGGAIDFSKNVVGVIAAKGGGIQMDNVSIKMVDRVTYEGIERSHLETSSRSYIGASSGDSVETSSEDSVETSSEDSVETSSEDSQAFFFLSNKGFIGFKDGYIRDSDTALIWVANEDFDLTDILVSSVAGGLVFHNPSGLHDEGEISASSRISDSIDQILEETITIMKDAVIYDKISRPSSAVISAGFENSDILISGKKSHGIYFNELKQEENEVVRQKEDGGARQKEDGGARQIVSLKKSKLIVSDGVAIYNNGLKGAVILEDSEVTGNILVKDNPSSDLMVFSHRSSLEGAVYTGKNATTKLFLSNGSLWSVRKDSHNNLEVSDVNSGDCRDSCISFLGLKDSSISFHSGADADADDYNYQVLRVGGGNGVAYSAKGDAAVTFNVAMIFQESDTGGEVSGDVGSNKSEISYGLVSDRLLIHGDVVGKTKVHLERAVGYTGERSGLNSEGSLRIVDKPHSISLIQVFGKAKEDSFKLSSGYITLGGLPYKFVLRAYPFINENSDASAKINYFDERLGASSKCVWDFRLEDENLPYNRTAFDAVNSTPFVCEATEIRESSVMLESLMEPPPIISSSIVDSIYVENIPNTCDSVKQNGLEGSQTSYSCGSGGAYTVKNLVLKTIDKTQRSMHARNPNTVITLENATISGADYSDKDKANPAKLRVVSAVLADRGAKVILKESAVQSALIGLEAQKGGKVEIDGGTVSVHYLGVLAGSESFVSLNNTKISTGDSAVAGLASKGGEITMNSGEIALTGGVAVSSDTGGSVRLNKVNITVNERKDSSPMKKYGDSAFLLSNNGSIDFTNGNVVTGNTGLWIRDTKSVSNTGSSRRRRSADVRPSINRANFELSTMIVEGNGKYGIYFDGSERGDVPRNLRDSIEKSTLISLKGAVLAVPKGTAIYSDNSSGRVLLEEKAILSGDLLLKSQNESEVLVLVNDSKIVGGVSIDDSSYARFELSNKSEWVLEKSRYGLQQTSDLNSYISSISLENSAIKFLVSESGEYQYQTLRIGKGSGEVYKAQGNAHVYFNTYLNTGGDLQNQKTDRLLIHGDVEGKTIIHVQGAAGSPGGDTGLYGNNKGISIVQVSGSARRDSFELDGGYVALGNSPYQYRLRPYGPESNLGKADPAQRLVEGEGEFWDYRLENGYVGSDTRGSALPIVLGGGSHSKPRVRAVVPQVPTYLSLPNSMFLSGLVDINNQNKQLGMLRTTSSGVSEIGEKPALYLHSYGSSFRYASDLSALEYGYESDLSYSGAEAGMLLQTIESDHSSLSFGVMGSYGKLSLQPLDVEQSQKSSFDKWMATAYGSLQHDGGFYVDGLVSYGLLKGDVSTLLRGKTATLKGQPFSVSLTGGQTFATGYEGFVFDPQTQVIYQHVRFDKASDIDGFAIEMGNLDQWIARFGGRLIKTPKEFDRMGTVSLYGQLYFLHGFGGKQTVRFKDDFQLSSFGSSLEAGFGFNARLTRSFTLHGDFTYQRKLSKAGFSGTSFFGGLRYQF